jgi:hypothetical protein
MPMKANGLDEFYSRMKTNGDVELFVDRRGNPTINYPHVHLVHKGNGNVDVISAISRGDHPWRTTLSSPSGQEVSEAVKNAQSYFPKRTGLLKDGVKNGYIEYRREGNGYRCIEIVWKGVLTDVITVSGSTTLLGKVSGYSETFRSDGYFSFAIQNGGRHNLT